MPKRTSQITQVGKRQLELSNLTKELYPGEHITKAHLIEYYLKISPSILAHIKGRPLSVVRYPDGVGGESFFQKNLPGWAPAWLERVTLGEEKKNYVLATEEASLVWLANLACIELHQMHSRAPHFDKPDYIAYDFDPPEQVRFPDVAHLALEFKEHLEAFGYHPFVKTTGRKGLHVVTPIEPKWEFHQVFDAAKAVAQPFVESHGTILTLQIKKEYRKGKVLLDIYRNRQSQTIVSPYSVRGLPGATVSTPLSWEELDTLESPKIFTLQSVPPRVAESGDPWETLAAYATAIHTEKKAAPANKRKLEPARTYKTPEQLEAYSRKRSFDKTPEPPPVIVGDDVRSPSHDTNVVGDDVRSLSPDADLVGDDVRSLKATPHRSDQRPLTSSRTISGSSPASITGAGNAFVVHRHHATRLHYDLRLEQNGVLKSWAVPKGLPPRPGLKRLAVNVEAHPLEYVHFEGAIPKNEYGGGMMWKFAQGRYEITKQKKDGFYFRLHSRELNGEYRIYHTNENQWLLERVDTPQIDWLRTQVNPMLARAAQRPPDSPDFVYEVKWDGIRALVSLDEGAITIHGRNGLDVTRQFPELLVPEQALRATSGLFDGEIVCLEADGRPNFRDVIYRMQQRSEGAIERAKAKYPAVCYLFDCLYLDGRAIVGEPLVRRHEWLQDVVKKDSSYRVSEFIEDGPAFFEAVKAMGLEGIMAKQRNSVYLPGKRSDTWLKIKTRQTVECLIIGYTEGKGDRQSTFGALHLAQNGGGELKYIGKAGSGFDEQQAKAVFAELEKLTKIKRPIKEKTPDDARSIWVEPKLICEVAFASRTPDGLLREPVFIRLRPDLTGGT